MKLSRSEFMKLLLAGIFAPTPVPLLPAEHPTQYPPDPFAPRFKVVRVTETEVHLKQVFPADERNGVNREYVEAPLQLVRNLAMGKQWLVRRDTGEARETW